MENPASLERLRQELEEKIRDVKGRLPAHSAKPPIMAELFELEDAYAEVLRKIARLKK